MNDISYLKHPGFAFCKTFYDFEHFSCKFTISRPDGSRYDSGKTLAVTRKAVKGICPNWMEEDPDLKEIESNNKKLVEVTVMTRSESRVGGGGEGRVGEG